MRHSGAAQLRAAARYFWAHDRSWVLCTDHDMWATKLAGPAPLVEALLADPEIEAVRLPWAH
ncbi:hypothetical protein [Streptomyces katrae]|uniref:hypothetical protein n=1 Tax=Streptomyces katrae TaxID=68223 RepID=UPI0004BF024D|nr:hypothetical protein [Streptomyces katrae]